MFGLVSKFTQFTGLTKPTVCLFLVKELGSSNNVFAHVGDVHGYDTLECQSDGNSTVVTPYYY